MTPAGWMHPWLRVSLAVRAILTTPWPPGAWPGIKDDVSRGLALRARMGEGAVVELTRYAHLLNTERGGCEMAARKRAKRQWGERTIRLILTFWTNGISNDRETLDKGTVVPQTNPAHGITPGRPVAHFNSMAEVPRAIEKCLIAHGIKIRPGQRSRKYITSLK